ncbi:MULTISPECIES: GNAT family N-acetyltransferase [unclassified Aureimonas]|uniref:GNAT family N-acetyltransferase n=1 Tax=unclassified Aureimonas TaxID=2615206 RepID=UPI0006F93372|nr:MULTISPECIES: GNAT family N-acetyltransferase [unclassified Aureimonas]KQT61748.1 GNAT family acetyltransferase [Aureimonas sp. Leaf460]KQT65705.1 GNAT family acetyltransferase [Aureimonas sp. Leaf427]
MQATEIELIEFQDGHLDAAVDLSRAEGWPHRREDWALVLSLSRGTVALEGGRVVGTALATPFGEAGATVNMVIVDKSMRGRGLGRRLMAFAIEAAGGRSCRLVATEDGRPLYEKLGFAATGEIRQHQGPVSAPARPALSADIDFADETVAAELAALDAQATGLDRSALFARLAREGRFAVLREAGRIEGFAVLRPFGRGEVAGPVVARTADEAKALLGFLFADRAGAFLRVDVAVGRGLGPFLVEHGLLPVGGGIAMQRGGVAVEPSRPVQTFALASQALG